MRGWISLLIGFAICLSCCGCEQRVVRSGWDQYQHGADRRVQSASDEQVANAWDFGLKSQRTSTANGGQWTINLGLIESQNHRDRAEQLKTDLTKRSGLKDLWIMDEPGGSRICYGRYKAPDDLPAQNDLRQWRKYRQLGVVPIAGLIPVAEAAIIASGSNPEYDLRRHAGQAAYTLVIGFFDENYGKDYRKAAEQAVETLRHDGDEAFYFHDPYNPISLVTIGLFAESAIVKGTVVDPRVKELQTKFPYSFGNGLERKITTRDRQGNRLQYSEPSSLIVMPKAP